MEYDQTLAEDMLPDPEPFRPADDDAAEPCESENETQTASTSSVQKDSKRTTTTTAISQSTVQQVLSEEDDNDIIYVAPPSSKRSQVWKHFGFYKQRGFDVVRQDKTCCKHCKTLINYHATGNTTNMTAHLSRAHSIKIEPVASIKRKAEDTSASEASQPKMMSMVKLKEGSPLHKTITESLVRYICMDFQPLSTVESRWFKDYTAALYNRYALPTRKRITKELIPNLFETLKQEKLEVLSCLDKGCCALTTDGWTSTRSNPPVNYETITCHYIDKCTWEVKTVNLETRPLGGASTAENLKSNLKRVMQEWSIYPSGITTDNASNVTKAMKLLQNLDDELLAYETEGDLLHSMTIVIMMMSLNSFYNSPG